jgi:hypothetical protein
MTKSDRSLEEVIKELPADLHAEVRDFAEFLLQKKKKRGSGKLRQDWAGALRHYRNKYTSLELQEKSLEWRGD